MYLLTQKNKAAERHHLSKTCRNWVQKCVTAQKACMCEVAQNTLVRYYARRRAPTLFAVSKSRPLQVLRRSLWRPVLTG